MSSSLSSILSGLASQIVTYMGMTTVIIGVVGNLLNIMVFLSLRTFRQSSCAFYLTVMSFVNIGQLLLGQLSRVMMTGFGVDWTQTSLFYCKFRWFLVQVCSFMSFSFLCFATIDQFFATCVRPYWQQWSNIKVAQRISIITIFIWTIYGIPYTIFYHQTVSASTGKVSCSIGNAIFQGYHTYVNNIFLSGCLPVCVTVLFGILAYRNVRQIAYRTVPLVRRELDKQLTNMVLIQIIFSSLFVLPYIITNVLPYITAVNNDPNTQTKVNFTITTIACIYYLYFACPFYLYIIVSDRFRQQFFYVLCRVDIREWCRQSVPPNQIAQQTT